jgi:hypothetical protein
VDATRQQTLAAPQRQRIDEQVQLVDQVLRKQRVNDLAATVCQNAPAGFLRDRLKRILVPLVVAFPSAAWPALDEG